MTTLERIKSASLIDAQKIKHDEAASAKAINATLSNPDLTPSVERREELTTQLEVHVGNAEAAGDRIEEIQASQSAAIQRQTRIARGEQSPGFGQPGNGSPGRARFRGGSFDAGAPMSIAEFKSMDPAALDDGGFDSLGDFAKTIYKQRHGFGADERLLNFSAAQSGGDNPSGGFLIPLAMSREIITSGDSDEPWLDLVDRSILPAGFGKIAIPQLADRDRSGKNIAGVALQRRDENSTVAEATTTIERLELSLDNAGVLVRVSQELIEDSMAGSVDQMLRQVFANALTQRLSQDVIAEIVNSPAAISVAKESGQAADTIVGGNLLKMREKLKPSSLNRAVWLVAPDIYRQLLNSHSTLTNDDYPLFIHGNGIDVPDTLLGRPIYTTEACSTLGDVGDVVLADLSKLHHLMRGPYLDSSPHVQFEQNQLVYRFLIRDRLRTKFSSTYTTLSGFECAEFVTLAARA